MLVKRKSRLGLKLLKLLAAPAIVSASFIYIFYFSNLLLIKEVKVAGDVSSEEAERFIGSSALSSNILFWKPKGDEIVEKKFLSIKVEKDLIDRIVAVTFEPRARQMIWCYEANEECFWVDKGGLLFESAPKPSGNLIRSATDVSKEPKTMGGYAIDKEFFDNLQKIFIVLEKLNIVTEKAVVEDRNLREFTVHTKSGPLIRFSLSINPDFTETAIESLLKSDSWQKIKSINLTVYGRAFASF